MTYTCSTHKHVNVSKVLRHIGT